MSPGPSSVAAGESRGVARWIAIVVGMAAALGVAVGAVFSLSGGGVDVDRFATNAVVSTLYGASIGVPAMLVLRWLQPRLEARALRPWLVLLGVVLATTLVGILVTRLVLLALGWLTVTEMWRGYLQAVQISLAIAVPCTAVVIVLSILSGRLAATERDRQRALALATEARLASLESRLRPHFLFNALNSAIALISEDPRRAEDVLERLSALLRFSLDAQAGSISLGEELRLVVDYLEIERTRFGERLAYELDVPDALRTLAVPAFAVQTLVENSVKYAVSARTRGARIVIRARAHAGTLAVEVLDDGPGFDGEIWLPGHGLDGLRARLDALHGAGARLVIPAAIEGGAAVSLEVPAITMGGAA